MAQDPQRYRGPDGSIYEALPGGGFRRTPPPQSAPAPAAPRAPAGSGYTIQPMETPAQRAQQAQQDRQFALSSEREERMTRAAEDTARQAAITATRLSPAEEDQLAKARAMAREAQNVMPDVERFGRLNRGQDSGGLYAVPFVDAIAGAFDPDVSQMNELTARFAPAQREEGSGPMSDADLALFLRAVPSVQRPREANDALIERARAEAARRIAYADFLDRFAAENLTLKGADAAFRAGVASGQIDIAPKQPAPELRNDGDPLSVAPGTYSGEYIATFDRDGDGVANYDEMTAAGFTWNQEAWRYDPPGYNPDQAPPPSGPQGGQSPQGQQGGAPQSQGYQTALEQERANADLVAGATGGYGMTDSLTGEFNDELAYGAGYVRQGLGNIGRRLTGRDIEVSAAERGRAARDVMVEDRDEFARERPVQNALGNVLGGAAFGPQGAARTMVGRAAQGSGIGATYGFAGAEGNVVERLPSAAVGAGIGAAATPVVERAVAPAINALARPVAEGAQSAGRFLGRQAGNVGNALGVPGAQRLSASMQPNPLASGMNRFADRMGPERVNALLPALAERRNAGLNEADLIDVLDDGSIGLMRALGTRDTPGRDVAVAAAEARRRNLPSRATRIANEEISPDTRPALQAIDDLSATRRANASAIDSFGGDEVPLPPDAIMALRSDFVRPHIRAAAQRAQGSTDPAEREAAARLNQLAEVVLDNPSAARLTVREAQDISKALNDAATAAFRNNPADGRVLANLGRTVRDSARDNSTGYAAWLRQYGDDSDMIEAATTGRNFVSVSRDPANARGTEAFVQRADQAGPAELGIQRAAAREAVETAASNPSGARTVLEGFANDTGQARRAAAIGADPQRLQARAGAELDSVTRHQRASPRIGSESSTNLQDAAGAAGAVAGTARDVMTGNVSGLAGRVMNAVRSRGFSNQEAEAIVRAANDPAMADQLVSMLAERMTRRDARSLARALRYQITTNPQPSQ